MFSLAHTGQLALLRYFLNGIVFTDQPKAPAFAPASAFGWAVNDYFNSLLPGSHQRL